jgi:hypothetical protein
LSGSSRKANVASIASEVAAIPARSSRLRTRIHVQATAKAAPRRAIKSGLVASCRRAVITAARVDRPSTEMATAAGRHRWLDAKDRAAVTRRLRTWLSAAGNLATQNQGDLGPQARATS